MNLHPALAAVQFLLRDRVAHGDVHAIKEGQLHLDAIDSHIKELDVNSQAPLPGEPTNPVEPPVATTEVPAVVIDNVVHATDLSEYVTGIVDELKAQ